MERLGYSFSVRHPTRTRDLTLQAKISFYNAFQATDPPLFEIYGCPTSTYSQSLESALVRALTYIDNDLDFKIADMNYDLYLYMVSGWM